MTTQDRYIADAARAAGEPLPGTAAEPTAESRELERLVLHMRSAQVPPSEQRRDAVLRRVREQRAPFVSRRSLLIAASVLVVLLPVAAWLRKGNTPIQSPPAGPVHTDAVFAEVFVPRTWEPSDPPPTHAPPAGAGEFGPSYLGPFADQVEFTLLVPVGLPRELQLMAARYRRAEPGVRSFPYVWLEYAGPEGRVIVLQVPEASASIASINDLVLGSGWRSATRPLAGVRALVASPDLSNADLATLAGRLRPFND